NEVALQATWEEYEPAQIAVYPLRDLDHLVVHATELKDAAGHVIPASAIVARMVRFYGLQLSQRVPDRYGVVPKTLEVAVPIDVKKGSTRPYWITLHIPARQPAGVYRGSVSFEHAAGQQALPLSVEVLPVKLQEPNVIYGTVCLNAFGSIGKM